MVDIIAPFSIIFKDFFGLLTCSTIKFFFYHSIVVFFSSFPYKWSRESMPTEEYSCIFIVFLFYIPNHFNLNISLLFSFYFSSIKQSLFLFISYIFLFFLFLKYLLSLYFFSPYQTKPYKRWYISDLRDTNPINCIYTYTIFNKKKIHTLIILERQKHILS